MTEAEYRENLIETTVTCSLDINGQFFLIENVPARVDQETGEQFFDPVNVERIQEIIRAPNKPNSFRETPVMISELNLIINVKLYRL